MLENAPSEIDLKRSYTLLATPFDVTLCRGIEVVSRGRSARPDGLNQTGPEGRRFSLAAAKRFGAGLPLSSHLLLSRKFLVALRNGTAVRLDTEEQVRKRD
jgi:hypothetical protein